MLAFFVCRPSLALAMVFLLLSLWDGSEWAPCNTGQFIGAPRITASSDGQDRFVTGLSTKVVPHVPSPSLYYVSNLLIQEQSGTYFCVFLSWWFAGTTCAMLRRASAGPFEFDIGSKEIMCLCLPCTNLCFKLVRVLNPCTDMLILLNPCCSLQSVPAFSPRTTQSLWRPDGTHRQRKRDHCIHLVYS